MTSSAPASPASPRVVVITGASAGIGKAAAEAFARMGWRVIATGRTPERCDAAEADIRKVAAPGATIDFLRGDFCEMADVTRIAGEIAGLTDRVHVLVNNAGGVRDQLYMTGEGLEATFAANHLAPFLLTRELMPLLERAAETSPPGTVRVIAVSSSGHEACPGMRWDDLMMLDDFSTGAAYCQAKLANILFTRELDRKLAGKGIVAQAMHPGVVHSNFASHGDGFMQDYLATLQGHTPEHAARTIVWMATAAELGRDGGRYFHDLAEVPAAPQALDDDAAARLWHESEKMLEGLGLEAAAG
ncbi:SDR family NAD(P)-dependent oxidoreductase [Novosphingobium album (ex Liu et al. 2023)]|uniref:SDR family NAD(P)-dependent oxidoreductase n=1 Tax=Novosphingobium album (ex Liu et al. 2023) TaxID=3031130 RepID=A0ABT5WW60_9SPHN|nr:SDR family NAD(P)-dependent oxidoreductase [Novosphingobium album (ex Liu et al. 2023)]MDE8654144.1 SDR family NAD(P)-dependent oxidoreductase [Novosphingobium album (ex Liu et al. 2023)]